MLLGEACNGSYAAVLCAAQISQTARQALCRFRSSAQEQFCPLLGRTDFSAPTPPPDPPSRLSALAWMRLLGRFWAVTHRAQQMNHLQ